MGGPRASERRGPTRARGARTNARLIAIVAIALVLAACAAPRPEEVSGDWQLEAGTLDGRPIPMVAGHRITLSIEGAKVGGRSACNWYGATVSLGNGAFRVTEIGGTAMLCADDVAASEAAYLAALRRVATVTTPADRLVLSGGGVELRFFRLAPVPIAEIVDTTWVLQSLTASGVAREALGDPATLELRSDGGLLGSTGCRTLTGQYVLRADEVRVTRLAATGDCPPRLMEQDAHVVTVIGDGFTVRVEGGTLILTSTGDQRLVYTAENGGQ